MNRTISKSIAFRSENLSLRLLTASWLLVFTFADTDYSRANAADDLAAIAAVRELGGVVRPTSDTNSQEWEVEFHLRGRDLTDEGLARVAALKRIVSLNLRDTRITDKGLVHLQAHTSLRVLHLERTEVGDEGVANLAGLKNLEYLNLYSTNITDKSLGHLTGLKKLKTLYVWQTDVTDTGVAQLKAKQPDLKVVRGVDLSNLPTQMELITKQPEPKENLNWIAVNRKSEAPKSNNGINTQVIFENKSGRRVKLYWVSYGNELKLYATLDPGATRQQNSYARNTWLITDESDVPLGYFIVTEEVSRAVIPEIN